MSLRVLDEMVASWSADRTTPTYRALMDRVGLRSTGDIHFHMRELQRAGLVELASGRRVYVPTHKALMRRAA
jgi:SOS-response transcriptional repressor LexA